MGVHCSNGRRRTGTALGAFLVASGVSNEESINRVFAVKPDADLREVQLDYLRSLVL